MRAPRRMLAVDRRDGKWYELALYAVPASNTHTFSRLMRTRRPIKNGMKAKEEDDNQIYLRQRTLVLANEQITHYTSNFLSRFLWFLVFQNHGELEF